MLIDTHCHLNFKAFEKDIDQVIKSAKEAGVEKIINIGADLESSQKAVEIAQKFKTCYASVGIHPHHTDNLEDCWEEKLREMAQQPKVVAIGECGLDYYSYKTNDVADPQIQKKIFLKQQEIARQLNLPVIVHCRQAREEIFSSINLPATGVFHCYSSGKSGLERVNKMGFYFGIDGNFTYDDGLRNVVKEIPLEKIILETDAPFLTPLPIRYQRNEPKNVKIIALYLAKIKKTSYEEVTQITSHNANSLFRFDRC